MENQENNNLIELQQLKVQYETLKQQFDQQEIVNNNIIHEMLHAGISNFKRRNAEIILIYGMLAATACWSWYYLDLRFPFMVISVLLFTLTGLFEWFSCQKILHINIEDVDVQTLVKKIDRGSTRFSLLWITVVFSLCLWMMWFIFEIGEKREIPYLRSSFVMVAIILAIAIVLIICNIDRLAKMSDELLAQTSRLNGGDASAIPSYHRSGAYWSGIVMLVLSLIVLVFKLMHWPFANLLLMAAGLAGLVFAWLTARHLVRVAPEERIAIRIAEIGCMILVISVVFKIMHFPQPHFFALVGLSFILIAALVYWQRQRRRKA